MQVNSHDHIIRKIAKVVPGLTPNLITIFGLLPPVLFFYLLINGRFGWAIVAYMGSVLDALDGAYARATGQVTKFGALLDSAVDRISDALFITAFGFAGLVSWGLVIAVLVSSFLISYIRARGEGLLGDKSALRAGPVTRSVRLAILFTGFIAYLIWPESIEWTFFVLLGLSLITVARRFRGARQELDK